MIKKRLVQIVPDSKKYIAGNVLFQWIALISNIVFMTMITSFIATLAVTKDKEYYSLQQFWLYVF